MTAHHFQPTILRAYDIRGIVGETLFAADARALGWHFPHFLNSQHRQPRIAVGRDGRLSSPELHAALIEGLQAAGAEVIDIGLGPTPMLYFADRFLECDGAIQVTGSHNPPDHNGFKMVAGHQSFYGEQILQLSRRAATNHGGGGSGSQTREAILEAYCSRLLEGLDLPEMSVVWDSGNGATGPVMEALASQLPGQHHLLFTEVDGRFPNHHPNPVDPETLGLLRAARAEQGAVCGIGFDGDGDRTGIIDEKGRLIAGDLLTAFLATEILARQPDQPVILDVKSSGLAMQIIEQSGGRPELWKTGHSHMKTRLADRAAPLAGEMSGHIFLADGWFGFDDGIYVGLRTLAAMKQLGMTITQFADQLPEIMASPEYHIACADEQKFSQMDAIARLVAETAKADEELLDIDGVRLTGPDGWFLLRASNTEPALVARAEGCTADQLASQLHRLQSILAEVGIDWQPGSR
jgi:phosphomannomutase